jgi:glutamate dehydrogenase/leucine dehydrogenase
MQIISLPVLLEPELQVELNSPEQGLRGYIVVDSTVLGPAAGGIRLKPYAGMFDALQDAKKLARAMTLKAALAGLDFGGAKSAICYDPKADRRDLFEALAREVDNLKGNYICGQDVGVTQADISVVRSVTSNVAPDLPGSYGSALATAIGVKNCIEVLLEGELVGKRIGIDGLGSVGGHLANLLLKDGALVFGADVNSDLLHRADSHVTRLTREDLYVTELDVLAPCAIGGSISEDGVKGLRCRYVCGAANNQLTHDELAATLHSRGIACVPDFLANAGGLIHNVDQFDVGGHNPERIEARLDGIKGTLRTVMAKSGAEKTLLATATALAQERIASAQARM